MRLPRLVPAVAAVAALALMCGCEDERSSGVILTADGRVMSNSAENNRRNAADRITESLDQRLGAHWRAKTTIRQLPLWDEGHDSEPEWRWDECDVVVEIYGDGQTTLPISTADVRSGVYEYMCRKVNRPARNLNVSVVAAKDQARFMALAHPAPPPGSPITYAPVSRATEPGAPPPPTEPGAAAPPPSYIIQPGDTWAALSTAFYGSPALWRVLADANHWNGGNPRVGESLVVPPPPGAAGPGAPPAASAPAAAPASAPASAPGPAPAPAQDAGGAAAAPASAPATAAPVAPAPASAPPTKP